jgi:hypothetical protein
MRILHFDGGEGDAGLFHEPVVVVLEMNGGGLKLALPDSECVKVFT